MSGNLTRIFTSSQAGSAQKDYGRGLVPLLSSISISLAVCVVECVLFCVLRSRFKGIYQPRAYKVPPRLQVREEDYGSGWVYWVWRCSLEEVYEWSGPDAYFFLRYLLLCLFICAACGVSIMPVLIGINSVGGSAQGLDTLSWSNIVFSSPRFYLAHLILSICLTVALCIVFRRELDFYVKRRHCCLLDPGHVSKASARTILVQNLPSDITEVKLKSVFETFPHGVKRIWLNRNYRELCKLQTQRDRVFKRLESAQTRLICKALKATKRTKSASKEDVGLITTKEEFPVSGMLWKSYLPESSRPTHRLLQMKLLWLIWFPKVDTLSWCKAELEKLSLQIETLQQKPASFPLDGHSSGASAFIEFHSQVSAHMACQSTIFPTPAPNPPSIEVNPRGIIWSNLSLTEGVQLIRRGVSNLATTLLIVGWAFPVGFIGVISQLHYMAQLFPFLGWLNQMPSSLVETASGILPSISLSLLLATVPKLFQYLAILRGHATMVQVQLDVQCSMFIFLFIQVFLVITVSAGITSLIHQLFTHPTVFPKLLAENLPKASNFFFAYIVIQSLSTFGNSLLQPTTLLMQLLPNGLFQQTPRDKFTQFVQYPTIEWGSVYPVYTNLAVISIIYSIISPLMVIFSTAAFAFIFFSFKYRLLLCLVTKHESNGLLYPYAIFQLFTGLYTMQFCLIGLFLLHTTESKLSLWYSTTMFFTFLLTILYHLHLYTQVKPLLTYLPISYSQETPQTTPNRNPTIPKDPRDIFDGIETEFSNLTNEQQEHLIEQSYYHRAIRAKRPCLWIPHDPLGIADDEINDIRHNFPHIQISSQNVQISLDGSITFTSTPPDYDPSLEMEL
ncbi:hypothetical protein TRICI_005974 [Trichomonascus ciferrii]|uniref:CSC1/OSCA1-like 7TM region domain-containing protein n=1 Tax=Trichomonascus ciferrii TaxID=44093 RepID=A0A642UPI2_9ASCO|nr:hypothetical protein TRICI_005974 [Trichomonascus ciferrii]